MRRRASRIDRCAGPCVDTTPSRYRGFSGIRPSIQRIDLQYGAAHCQARETQSHATQRNATQHSDHGTADSSRPTAVDNMINRHFTVTPACQHKFQLPRRTTTPRSVSRSHCCKQRRTLGVTNLRRLMCDGEKGETEGRIDEVSDFKVCGHNTISMLCDNIVYCVKINGED